MSDQPVAERMLATVLFTDMVGSTERAVELGDAEWGGVLEAHHATIRRELGRFQGREVATAGDGFLALFDSPARAILCAKAIVEAVRAIDLHIRAGIHTGECELVGDNVRGIAVHIGARVAGLAGPDEILVSGTVKELVQGSHIEFVSKGSRALKGVPGRWRLFAVKPVEEVVPEPLPSRPLLPLVGRAAEVDVIRDRLDAASDGGLGVVTVEGEAGIGKTRLLDEAALAAAEKGFAVVYVGADEEIGGPFYVARMLLSAPEVARAGTDAASKRALKRAIELVGGKDDATLESLPLEDQLLVVYDAAVTALSAVASKKRAGAVPGRPAVVRPRLAPADPLPGALGGRGAHVRHARLSARRPGDARRDPGHVGRRGTPGRGPADRARPAELHGDNGAPGPPARGAGEPEVRGGDLRPERGRAVHRQGAGPVAPGGGDRPVDRRDVGDRAGVRAHGPGVGAVADRTAGRGALAGHPRGPGGRGRARAPVRAGGPHRADPSPEGRFGAVGGGARDRPG